MKRNYNAPARRWKQSMETGKKAVLRKRRRIHAIRMYMNGKFIGYATSFEFSRSPL